MRTPCISVLLSAALLTSCTPSDPLEQAALAASRAGTIANLRGGGQGTAGIEAAGRVAAHYYWVKKYAATPVQRAVATERAKSIVQTMKKRHTKVARYIAVDTKGDSRASTQTNVMLWDTQSESIVGNSVYDVNERPPKQETVRFETFSASYVGKNF